jgi:hypothetical protein
VRKSIATSSARAPSTTMRFAIEPTMNKLPESVLDRGPAGMRESRDELPKAGDQPESHRSYSSDDKQPEHELGGVSFA